MLKGFLLCLLSLRPPRTGGSIPRAGHSAARLPQDAIMRHKILRVRMPARSNRLSANPAQDLWRTWPGLVPYGRFSIEI
jgi:hypothetical protein